MRVFVAIVAMLVLGALQADAQVARSEVKVLGLLAGQGARAMTCTVAGLACTGAVAR